MSQSYISVLCIGRIKIHSRIAGNYLLEVDIKEHIKIWRWGNLVLVAWFLFSSDYDENAVFKLSLNP